MDIRSVLLVALMLLTLLGADGLSASPSWGGTAQLATAFCGLPPPSERNEQPVLAAARSEGLPLSRLPSNTQASSIVATASLLKRATMREQPKAVTADLLVSIVERKPRHMLF